MMRRNPPNARPQDPHFESFADEYADLRSILTRSAAAQDEHHHQRDRYDREWDDDLRQERDPYQRDPYRQEGDAYRHDPRRFLRSEAAYEAAYDDDEQDLEPADYDYYSPPFRLERWPVRRKSSISLRILLGVLVAAGMAVMFALLTSDATQAVITSAREALSGAPPERSARVDTASTRLTPSDLELKDPARFSTRSGRPDSALDAVSTAAAPSREDIEPAYPRAAAYQSVSPYRNAPQSRALLAAPPFTGSPPAAARAAAAPTRTLAPDELAKLMRRARSMLAVGDIPSARLLLERMADARDASAAFILAQTYDPQALATRDAREIRSDPAAARAWYERAAELGSIEARRHLSQLENQPRQKDE